jgi:hypothetical protein
MLYEETPPVDFTGRLVHHVIIEGVHGENDVNRKTDENTVRSVPDARRMSMKRSLLFTAVLIAVFSFVVGCSKPMTPTTPVQDIDAPEWVKHGSGAFEDDRGKVFYGVGSAYGIKNPPLLRQAADNRARNEVSKVFETYTSSLMRDYMASTTAGDPDVTSEEQHVEQAIKTVSANTLSGIEVVEHWQHPATGEFFSLARLDLEAFKDSLEKSQELNARVKERIKKNAERLHEELEKEEEKMELR